MDHVDQRAVVNILPVVVLVSIHDNDHFSLEFFGNLKDFLHGSADEFLMELGHFPRQHTAAVTE